MKKDEDLIITLLLIFIVTIIAWFLFVVYLDNMEQKNKTKYKHELLPGQVPIRSDSFKGTIA